jgi:hypothetical protein
MFGCVDEGKSKIKMNKAKLPRRDNASLSHGAGGGKCFRFGALAGMTGDFQGDKWG